MTIRTGCLSVVRNLKVERLKIYMKGKKLFSTYLSENIAVTVTRVSSVCFPLSVVGSCLICLLIYILQVFDFIL